MTQQYETPEWKKWGSIYCSSCYKWLGNFKGWFIIPDVKLYCRKCTEKIQKEQQTLVTNGISGDNK